MKICATPLSGLHLVESSSYSDTRGSFMRLFCEQELAELIKPRRIVQINHSRTSAIGALRGLHFQYPPHAEVKLVRCLKGRVWDVAVDLRRHSPTFLQWHAEELTSTNAYMMVIPEGFAHGFQALEPDSELLYLHTAFYEPKAEGSLRYDDPCLNIPWPLPPIDLSARDRSHPFLEPSFKGISL